MPEGAESPADDEAKVLTVGDGAAPAGFLVATRVRRPKRRVLTSKVRHANCFTELRGVRTEREEVATAKKKLGGIGKL